MFEPNSIKSLLTRRQSAKVQQKMPSDPEKPPKALDPDYESLIDTKIMIKGIP